MSHVLLVIHLIVAVALIVVVLMQRSEGGALGVGGGASMMPGRSMGNPLTRATAVLAAAFFLTSIGLTILARSGEETRSILDSPGAGVPAPLEAPTPEPLPDAAPAAPAVPLAK